MAIDKAKILKAADKYIAKQNYNKALDELLKVLKVSPNDVNLLNKIGDLYSKLGKEKSAIDYFLKVAISYQTSGFNLKAIALYKKIIRIDERYMDARHRLVDLYIQQGYHSETKGELRRMAEFYYSENLFSRALSCYEKMVELDPNSLDARIKITELLVREGKRDEAMEHFVVMGRELLEKSMINEARKIISQGLKMSPDHPGLEILLSQAYLEEGKTDEALSHLTHICQREPDNLDALNLLGKTYLNRRQLDDAKLLSLRIFELGDQNPGMLEEVSQKLLEVGQLEDAFECLKPLGEMFLNRNEHEEATRLFRSVLYINEDHLPSQEMLIRIYRDSNQGENALLLLEKVVHSYLDKGQDSMACARISEILELYPNNQEWRDKLGELSANMTGGDLEADEIHVFDEQSMDTSLIDESALEVDLSGHSLGEEGGSEGNLANHLTEAKVFIKYGIMDQALEHLEAAKEIDFLNEEVNQNLKEIYLQKGDLKKAIPCIVSLVNAALENSDFERAYGRIAELAKYSPEIAGIHKHRVDSIAGDGGHGVAPEPQASADNYAGQSISDLDPGEGFDLDFGDEPVLNEPDTGLLFEPSSGSPDVVEFRDMQQAPPAQPQDGGQGWSLDMPPAVPPPSRSLPKTRGAEEFKEIFDPAALVDGTGAYDLPDLADFADDSRFDLSIPADLIARQPGGGDIDVSDLLDLEESQSRSFGKSSPGLKQPATPVARQPQPAPPAPPAPKPEVPAPPVAARQQPAPPVPKPAVPTPPVAARQQPAPKPAAPAPPVAARQQPAAPAPKPAAPPVAEKPEARQKHAPLGTSGGGSLASELEEIDFFISVEAFEDARNLIEDARKNFGEHPLLMERQRELDAKTQNAARSQGGMAGLGSSGLAEDDLSGALSEGGGIFDLAAELSEELFENEPAVEVNDATSKEEIQSVEELFEEFRKGVDEQIEAGDFETHYDLGIAYKEMGLVEEAINEFTKAAGDPNKLLECAIMIGNCLVELGRTEEAIKHHQAHLLAPNLSEDADLAIRYELAQAFQSFGDLEKALEYLRQIQERSPDYRDVDELIDALV